MFFCQLLSIGGSSFGHVSASVILAEIGFYIKYFLPEELSNFQKIL